ncbi:MAG: hypothetical protein JWO32_1582, partial [Bacteroidetes bacterium]|nr:hypothetical protein [Bacteroidota bacterium]
MSLRFNTLLIVPLSSLLYKKALFLMFVLLCAGPSMAQTVNEELKNNALKAYEEENYVLGYKLYSQLVANFPKDPEYNFRLGVCMIYAEPDKQKCLPYLKFANSKTESPKEVKFYLGKAYHINYLFDEAIKNYNDFKNVGSSSQQKKLQVDREIKACGYGKRLLSNLSDLVIQNKKQLNEADYFRSYNLKNIGGKLLAKPEDFKTSTDKKKKDKSIAYMPAIGNRVYYSSYGNGDNRDIYYVTKLANGTFSPAQQVTGINSDQDEDYPFLHPNGTTLYFASKGYNSMGGYDIFKSTYIESSNSWSQPVNLEFPINSPDDDYLYVTDSLEKIALFSTGRQSLPGKIDVLTISTERKPIDVLALKGTVVKESAEQSLKSRITVKNMDNGNIVGIFDARDNGDYLMELPNGANLLYTVETPGINTQSDRVALPMVSTSKPLRQTISYDKGILKIINYFEETPTDDSYLQYLKIIEKKAKLEVNQGENKLNTTLAANENKNAENNKNNAEGTVKTDTSLTKTSPKENNTGNNKNKTGLDNKQLSDISRKEAEELAKEGTQLTQDANDAFEVGNQKKIEADKKLKDAEEAVKVAESLTNEEEKKSALEKAKAIKKEAEDESALATKILAYANTLKEDASFKIQESNLNKEYADELTKISNSKNNSKEALDKLDNIQKQIDAVSGHKNKSEEIFASFKNDADEKEKEISGKEKSAEDIKTNIQEIKEAISENETDLSKAKKKEKDAIQNKITELKADQAQKEKQYEITSAEIRTLKDELTSITKGVELANKIKNETIAVNTNTQVVASQTTSIITPTNSAAEKITSKNLAEKYKDKTTLSDNTNKDLIEQNSTELKNYNNDIETVLAKDKAELVKTNNPAAKQQLASEIKQLETVRKQNQQKIAANTKKIEDLNKAVVTNGTNPKNNEVDLITSNDNADAIKKLNNLNANLSSNDNANFEYNGYQNPQAQKLKVDADTKINESVAQQKKLKDLIEIAKGRINAATSTNTAVSPQQLSKEAEELSVKAFDLRSQASNKSGAEKETLLAQAKTEEAKANEKNLQLSEIIKSDNKIKFDTDASNLKLLIADKKASEGDLTEAGKLADEANIAYKQALSIREEANSLTSTGAKLGSFS